MDKSNDHIVHPLARCEMLQIWLPQHRSRTTLRFEHLTQAIMCAADDTIEPSFVAETSDGKRVRVIDGDGVVHQCRDFDGMYAAVMKIQIEHFGLERELRDGDIVYSTLELRD
ncbi:hypothetical protein DL95DRAFT_392509 [Leptodontidium sp. 2 PMI_412]|nr:hypothetical protein DL95DRAFT_392509 [Leptodontidium sp. 2 PMI_412]